MVDCISLESLAGTFKHSPLEALYVGVQHVEVLDAFGFHEIINANDWCAIIRLA